jgi:hypothetical protein
VQNAPSSQLRVVVETQAAASSHASLTVQASPSSHERPTTAVFATPVIGSQLSSVQGLLSIGVQLRPGTTRRSCRRRR